MFYSIRVYLSALLLFATLITPTVELNAQADKKPVLRYKLTSRIKSVCYGGQLDVRSELKNISGQDVVIDEKGIWYRSSYSYSRKRPVERNVDGSASFPFDGGVQSTIGDPGPDYQGVYTILKPGQSYKSSRSVKVDSEFFNKPGEFKMKFAYGQFQDATLVDQAVWRGTVESNELKFRVRDCAESSSEH